MVVPESVIAEAELEVLKALWLHQSLFPHAKLRKRFAAKSIARR
jgi:hypothetical protein